MDFGFIFFDKKHVLFYSPNRFICRGSGGLSLEGEWNECGGCDRVGGRAKLLQISHQREGQARLVYTKRLLFLKCCKTQ